MQAWNCDDWAGPVTARQWPSSAGPHFGTRLPISRPSAFEDALAAGVNHLDVAPQYGRAQELLGPSIPSVRDRLFVACKTLRHNGDGVRAQLEESLRLLRCDHFDLYQLHAVTDLEELDARAGAVEAIMAARDEGLCRWVGITGHNLTAPAAHLEALRRYDLDTVMFPVNPQLWSDPVYRRDAEALLAHAAEHDVGVMAIKAAAARPWDGRPRSSATWYEPYTAAGEVERGGASPCRPPGSTPSVPRGPGRPPNGARRRRGLHADGRRPAGGRGGLGRRRAQHLPDACRLIDVITGGDHPVPGSKIVLRAPLQGTVVGTPAAVGDTVAIGSPVVILESMKMEHVVGAPARGTVVSLDVDQGAPVAAGTPLAVIEIALVAGSPTETRTDPDFGVIRPELAELIDRQAQVLDSGRPEVVARRHARGRRTARENIADLCDPDSFTEYGSLAIAAQRGRRPEAELHRPGPGRRPGGRGRTYQRGPLRRPSFFVRCPLVRLHRVGRDPGPAEPPQERPPLRAHRTDAASRCPVRRGWGRATGRHGLCGDHRPRHHRLRQVRSTERAGPHGRCGFGMVFRRQRRPARML